jgi:enterochelin esterase-like enzyme
MLSKMKALLRLLPALALASLLSGCVSASAAPSPDGHTQVVVRVAPWLFAHHKTGRAIVVFSQRDGHVLEYNAAAARWDAGVYSVDVHDAGPGSVITFDRRAQAYPRSLDDLPPGAYNVMALIDWKGTYAYSGPAPGMDASSVSKVYVRPGTRIDLAVWRPIHAQSHKYSNSITHISVSSPELSRFWHRPVQLNAVVALPPGYSDGVETYPVLYVIHAFRASGEAAAFNKSSLDAPHVEAAMQNGTIPKMIVVYPDARWKYGHTEFADSANNGPWGTAFVRDLVAYVEHTYRARPEAQFLTGHSSGAWSALWLQTAYPSVFAGAWAVSPDPVDFRSFLGTDIYAANANLYGTRGRQTPYQTDGSQLVLTTRQAERLESVEGRFGGQIASFEAVFSPRGHDGNPEQLFDRKTGRVNPAVAAAWQKYDLTRVVAQQLRTNAYDLRGKLHVIVGSDDNFGLNRAVALFARSLPPAADESTEVLAGRNHFNIYADGLGYRIIQQMRRLARAQEAEL